MTNNLASQDAELAVLSIIFSSPDLVYNLSNLKSFMFNSSTNQLIYSVVNDLAEKNSVPEFNLVCSTLDSKGKLREAGGVDYLNYIKNFTASRENLSEYEKQIRASYRSRSLLAMASVLPSKITGGEDIDHVILDLKKNLDLLDDSAGGEQISDMLSASSSMWENLVTRLNNPGIRGVPTGFYHLDVLTGGYNPGDLWIVAGRPSMGKSADMCNSALITAEELLKAGNGESIAIFSLEMNKIALVERMVAIKSGIPLAEIRQGTLTQDKLDLISETLKYFKTLPIYIDNNFSADEAYYTATVRKLHKVRKLRVTFFDYLQLGSEREADQTAEIGRFTRASKLLANDLGITNVLYSQLNRGVELRQDKRPVLSDLRQSGNIEEDADIVEFLYRDVYYDPNTKYPEQIEKIIRKHRNGPIGTLFYHFDKENLRITDG